ncbi:hypothetical protein JGG61_23420 [Salmonella enterica subsp. enterica serovar London]|nr:hypothetical protein [Salmonella enterica subsp. enterica serovar London]
MMEDAVLQVVVVQVDAVVVVGNMKHLATEKGAAGGTEISVCDPWVTKDLTATA